MRFQREQLDRASTFSDTWQRALWQNPDIDYTLQRPVNTVAKRAWLDNRKADRDQVLTSLSQRYGLFYFYAQSCGACEVFAPILRSVADSHRMAVMAVSMDGGPSRDFPNYVVDSGQRARMGISGNETPALVLFDTATKRTIPVGYGSRASTSSSSSLTHEQALARARSYTETARKLEELSQQLSRDASYAETHGMQLSENMSQDLAQWYRAQQASNPGLDAPELWATDLGDHQRAVRQEMVTRWLREKQGDIREEIAGKLREPDLVQVDKPGVGSAADVAGSYRPHGVSGTPSGPVGGDPRAAKAAIETGEAKLDDDRTAAQAARAGSVQGSLGVQQEVHRDHNRGFFNDPKLRE